MPMYGLSSFFPHEKKKGEKRICGCHWASCGRFPLGWHAAVVFCHRASGDIMWAYQVAARVSGGMWVTQCLVSSEPQRFLPSLCPLSAGGAARVRGISRPTLSGGELVRPRREQSLQTLKKKKERKKIMSIKFSRRLLKIEAVARIKYWLSTSILYVWMNFNVPFYAFRKCTTHVQCSPSLRLVCADISLSKTLLIKSAFKPGSYSSECCQNDWGT